MTNLGVDSSVNQSLKLIWDGCPIAPAQHQDFLKFVLVLVIALLYLRLFVKMSYIQSDYFVPHFRQWYLARDSALIKMGPRLSLLSLKCTTSGRTPQYSLFFFKKKYIKESVAVKIHKRAIWTIK